MGKKFIFSLQGDASSVCHEEKKHTPLGSTTLTLSREKKKLRLLKTKVKSRLCLRILDRTYHLIPNETPLLLTDRDLSTLILTNEDNVNQSFAFSFPPSLPADVRAAFLLLLSSQSKLMVFPPDTSEMRSLLDTDLKPQRSPNTLDVCVSDIQTVSDSGSTLQVSVKPSVKSESIAKSIEKEFCHLNQEVTNCATGCAEVIRRPPPSAANPTIQDDIFRPSVEISGETREATKKLVTCARASKRRIMNMVWKFGHGFAALCPWCTRAAKESIVVPALAASFVGINNVFSTFIDASFIIARACADRISSDVSSAVSQNVGRITENVLHSALNVGESVMCITDVLPTTAAMKVATSAVCSTLNEDQEVEAM